MLPLLIAGLAAAAVLLIAVGISMSGGSSGVASRLERYARSGGDTSAEDDADKDSAVMAGLSSVIERQGATERLATEIARADLKLRPAEFVALWIASPFVFVAASLHPGLHLPGPAASVHAGRDVRARSAGSPLLPAIPPTAAREHVRHPAAGHHHPARELPARRLFLPPGPRAGHARGPAAHLRGVRARGPRDEPGRGAAAGPEQHGPSRRSPRTWS